jgi:hypothetical protein
MLTVHELRKRGYKVKVNHTRRLEIKSWQKDVFSPRGGVTEVIISDNSGSILGAAAAQCSKKDNFNRKRGVRIALGRALKQMGLPTK